MSNFHDSSRYRLVDEYEVEDILPNVSEQNTINNYTNEGSVNSTEYSLNVEHLSNIEYESNSNLHQKPSSNCESTVIEEPKSPGLFKSFLDQSLDNIYSLYVHPEFNPTTTAVESEDVDMSPTYTEMTSASASAQSEAAITINAFINSQATTTKNKVGRKPLSEEVKVQRAQEKELIRLPKKQAKSKKVAKK